MATNSLQPGAVPANADARPSRRNFLIGAMAAPVIALPVAASAMPASGDFEAFKAAQLKEYERFSTAADKADEAALAEHRACEAAIEAEVPHVSTRIFSVPYYLNGKPHCFDTSEHWMVDMFQHALDERPKLRDSDSVVIQAGMELLALNEQREAKIAAIKSRFPTEKYEEEAHELWGKAFKAIDRIIERPARSVADILSKLDVADEYGVHEEALLEAVTADLKRIAGEARHG